MASIEVRRFSVTTPVGVAKSTPQVTDLAMPPRVVDRIDVRIPPGPNGVLGFAFGAAGTPIIPVQAGQFIVTSDEYLTWDMDGQIDSGAWQLFSYNTGQFPHTVEIWFFLSLVGQTQAASVSTPIPAAQLAPMTADDLAALGVAPNTAGLNLDLPSPDQVQQ